MSPEDQFEKITRETIEKAENVDCSFEEFLEGLKNIVIELQDRIDAG